MIKKCYVVAGEIINIGDWDYEKEQIEISQAEYDEEGNVTKEAVFEEVARNPLPVGTLEEERDFEYSEERGWFEAGKIPQSSEIQILKEENEFLKGKLQTTEHIARETSQAQQELLELLIEMGVI